MDLDSIVQTLNDSTDAIAAWQQRIEARLNKLDMQGIARPAAGAKTRPLFPSVKQYEEARSARIGIDTDGGFLVVDTYSGPLFDRLRAQNVVMAAEPIVVQTDGDALIIPTVETSTTAGAYGEGATITGSSPVFGRTRIAMRKFGAYSTCSSELLADSNPAARELIAADHTQQLANLLDVEMLEGNGAGNHFMGLRYAGQLTTLGSGNGAVPDLDDVEAMLTRLEAANVDMERVRLFMAPRTWSTLRTLQDDQHRYQLQPDPTAPARRQLFGVPVSVSSQMSITQTVGSSSDCSYLVACDMSRVVVGSRLSVSVLIDPYSNSQTDQIAIRSLTRVGFALVTPTACEVLAGVRASS
jgi:HK97 family phage major capsid protein